VRTLSIVRIERKTNAKSLVEGHMLALLVLLLSVIICLPAFAGPPPASTPEIDPGTLAAITSGITGAYFVYRTHRLKNRR